MYDIKQYKAELETICDFTEIYDSFRLVNPDTNEIYYMINGKAVLSGDGPCYKMWNRDSSCDNCVSRRVCRDNVQHMKLEYLGGRVLMVVSKPVILENQKFALELIMDVTNSMVVQDEFHHNHAQIGIAALIEKVNRLSISDVFTGLYNNAYIKNKISTLVQEVRTEPFSILILDIDSFKQVNDHYGHLAGDAVIHTVATTLKADFAGRGYSVGRMGGDEYCIVLENCTLEQAKQYAQDTIKKISVHRYEGRGEYFTIEVSVGMGEYTQGEDIYAFIERVDCALYEEKHLKEAARRNPGAEQC